MKSSFSKALERAGAYFMKSSPIHAAARRIAATLAEMEVPFAIAGALAINAHGHSRMTQDVDILTTSEGLAKFKAAHLGRGWVEKFEGSRGLRDTIHNVSIDVLITGDFPGDGLPKPIAFPSPEVAELDEDGIPILPLKTIVELKVASGMTATHRPRDLDDVIQLIRLHALPLAYSEHLDPYVQEKFKELWTAAQVNEDY